MIGSLRPAPTFDVGSGRGVTVKRKGLGPNAEHWRVRWRRDCGPEPAQPSPCQHIQCWQRLTVAYWWPGPPELDVEAMLDAVHAAALDTLV